MKRIALILIVVACLAVSGCQLPFDRTYSVNYTDEEGRSVGGSVKFAAAKPKANKNVVPLESEDKTFPLPK